MGSRGATSPWRMLQENGIDDVKVTQIDGRLTDHYNPSTHTVNLSREVYYGNSVAAAAVSGTRVRPCRAACPGLLVP